MRAIKKKVKDDMRFTKTIRISESIFEKLEHIKEDLHESPNHKPPTWNEVLDYLTMKEVSRVKLKGVALAEKTIIKFLILGHHKEINASELRKLVPVNLTACNKALELWSMEVEDFNSQFYKE
jgi:hypothetical protein